MNRQVFEGMWDHFRQMHGMGLRCVAALPADKLDSVPIPGMRTPKQLLVHTYSMAVRACAEAIPAGQMTLADEEKLLASIKSGEDLLRFCRECWNAADRSARAVTDAHLQGMVKTPFGMDFPGFVIFTIGYDEYLHHRGQLYAYLRAFGIEPPMMWDFEHNEPEFQPRKAG